MASLHLLHDEGEAAILPAVRRILASTDIDACHAAIAAAARHVENITATSVRLVCEIAFSGPSFAPVWQMGTVPGDGPHFQAWLARACRQPGRLTAMDGIAFGMACGNADPGAPWIAILADCGEEPPPALESGLRDVCVIAAQHLHNLREREESRRLRLRANAESATQTDVIKASADLLWEAPPDGTVHITHVFNGRTDLARRFEGRTLSEISAADGHSLAALASEGRPLRALHIDLAGVTSGEPAIYMTLCPRTRAQDSGPAFVGAISAGPDLSRERLAIDTHILETMLAARAREEDLVRETEIMLMGLRVLLDSQPLRDKLEQLARHLASAMHADDVRLIQLKPGETPRQLLPPAALGPASAETLLRVLALTGRGSLAVLEADSEDNAVVRAGLGMAQGPIALIALPYEKERFFLLCHARGKFRSQDIGLAERFALLLKQALLLQQDQDRLLHAAKLSALGQMSASIAHELRQPLNTISIAAQNMELMLEMDSATPEMLREKATRILGQVDRAAKVMDRVRRFGRKTGGDYKEVSLAALALSARALMEHATVGVDIDVAVPDDIMVLADALEIEQVLVNLIQNAADAVGEREPAQGRIRIAAENDTDAGTVRLHVEDNGSGFAPDAEKHALDAFFTTKPEGKGTGLGLSISHAILREHGGRLTIGNGLEGGRVTLFLRRAAPAKTDTNVVALAPRKAAARVP